ncbi:response regulator [Aliirhizobium smilacinae]|jgi:CheY-like chemotaxis protein|uniref:Response regulator n=1 Tax=Aliirhizobium smilacinae TaxID=1395944 RepID=A0A5C4XH90_9HYPH|nr:response regulator [Rhizobium smilacinae]TNM62893.1 response regulator [Rhizobium smilacinae]
MAQSTPINNRTVVLVVEDEPLQRMMAVDLVLDAGFDVVEAWSADEAVTILESRTDIRIVFTDVDMPGSMDGLKLAASIRDRWPPIELIVTSGHIRMNDVDLPARSVFFPKPYDTEKVTAQLNLMAAN